MSRLKDLLLILIQFSGLYGLFMIGSMISEWVPAPIPGSIIGMIILLFLLGFNIVKADWLMKGARLLIAHMPFLFLPIMAGLVQHLDLIRTAGGQLFIVTAFSTWIVMIVTSVSSETLLKKRGIEHD